MKKRKDLSVIIAEDVQHERELLTDYILCRNELKLSAIARNGSDAIRKITEKDCDLLFLDVNFPDISGIEVLERIDIHPYVIFTTSYDKYALKAFELGAIDYLLKPFSQERFNQAVDKAIDVINNEEINTYYPQNFALSFKMDGINHIIPYEDIIFLSSDGRRTIIHTEDRSFDTAHLLKSIEKKLPDDSFSRIHKQFIVNLKFVTRLEYLMGGQLVLNLRYDDNTALPVGRTYAPVLKKKLGIETKY